jgi:hypothetical protein
MEFLGPSGQAAFATQNLFEIYADDTNNDLFNVLLEGTSVVGYTGGELCSVDSPLACPASGGGGGWWSGGWVNTITFDMDNLQSGSLVLTSTETTGPSPEQEDYEPDKQDGLHAPASASTSAPSTDCDLRLLSIGIKQHHRIITSVRIFVPILRLPDVVHKSSTFALAHRGHRVRRHEPPHTAGVVPCPEVVEPALGVSFFAGEPGRV